MATFPMYESTMTLKSTQLPATATLEYSVVSALSRAANCSAEALGDREAALALVALISCCSGGGVVSGVKLLTLRGGTGPDDDLMLPGGAGCFQPDDR
eukprot:scaffold57644_cov38-Prasinocladus_malaysianus.AAC.2